jgi:hypothetical protein
MMIDIRSWAALPRSSSKKIYLTTITTTTTSYFLLVTPNPTAQAILSSHSLIYHVRESNRHDGTTTPGPGRLMDAKTRPPILLKIPSRCPPRRDLSHRRKDHRTDIMGQSPRTASLLAIIMKRVKLTVRVNCLCIYR